MEHDIRIIAQQAVSTFGPAGARKLIVNEVLGRIDQLQRRAFTAAENGDAATVMRCALLSEVADERGEALLDAVCSIPVH